MVDVGDEVSLADYVRTHTSSSDTVSTFVTGGIPLAVTLLPAVVFITRGMRLRCGMARTRACFTQRAGCCLRSNNVAFERWATPLGVAVWVVFGLVPLVSLVAWSVLAGLELDPSFLGPWCGLLALSLAGLGYGSARWWAEGWRMTRGALGGLGVGLSGLVACVGLLGLWITPYSFHALSAVLLPLSAIPIVCVWYLNAPAGPIWFADFAAAKGLVAPGLADPDLDSSTSDEDESEQNELQESTSSSGEEESSSEHLDAFGAYDGAYRAKLTLLFLVLTHGVLATLGLVTFTQVDSEIDGYKYLGFARWGGVAVGDALLAILYAAEMLDSPLLTSAVSIWVRGVYAAAGSKFWLLGDGVVVFSLASFLLISFVLDRWPRSLLGDGTQPAQVAHAIITQLPRGRKLDFSLPAKVDKYDINPEWEEIMNAPPTPPPSSSDDSFFGLPFGSSSSEYQTSSGEYEYAEEGDGEYEYEYEDENEEEQEEEEAMTSEESGTSGTYVYGYAYEYTYGSSNATSESKPTSESSKPTSGLSSDGTVEEWMDEVVEGSWFRKYVVTRPLMTLVLEAGFGVALYVLAGMSEEDLPLERLWERSQFTYCVSSMIAAPCLALVFGAFRAFQRANYRLTPSVVVVGVLAVGAIVGNGVVFFLVLDSEVVLVVHAFTPVILGGWVLLLRAWAAADFYWIAPLAEAPRCSIRNVAMLVGLGAQVATIAAFGVLMGVYTDSLLTGMVAAGSALLPFVSYITLKAYFGALKFTSTVYGGLGLQVLLLGGFGAVSYFVVEDAPDEFPVWLLVVLVGYPVAMGIGATLWKWRDAAYVVDMSTAEGRTIVGAFLGSFALAALVPVGLILLLEEWVAGIAVGALIVVAFGGAWIGSIWVRSKFYLARKYRMLLFVFVVVLEAGAVYVGVTEDSVLGAVLVLGVAAAVLGALAFQAWLIQRERPVLFSRYVFPVYWLDPKSDTLNVSNRGTLCAYGSLFMVIGTGLGLAFVLERTWIGLMVASYGLVLVGLFSVHLVHLPALAFGSLARYVTEGILQTALDKAGEKELASAAVPTLSTVAGGGGEDEGESEYVYEYEYEEQEQVEVSGYEYVYGSGYEYESGYDMTSGDGEGLSGSSGSTGSSWSLSLRATQRGEGYGATVSQVLQSVKRLERTADGIEEHRMLLDLDRKVVELYRDEQRFVVHMQALVVALARVEAAKELALVKQLLVDRVFRHEFEDALTVWEVEAWDDEEWDVLDELVAQFNIRRKLDANAAAKRLQEDEEAQRKRDEARLVHQREMIRAAKKAGAKPADPSSVAAAPVVTAKEQGKAKAKAQAKAKGKGNKKGTAKGKEEVEEVEEEKVVVKEDGPSAGLQLVFKPSQAGSVGPHPRDVVGGLKAGQKWDDAEFPANEKTLYTGAAGVSGAAGGWARPEEMFEAAHGRAPSKADIALFGPEGVKPGSVKQGALGDCWLLSAISIVAQYPALIEALFVTKEPDEQGVYCIQFWNDGQWIRVLVDDQLPVSAKKSPLYARAAKEDGSELWTMLLEKAYAKMFGTYGALNGGMVHIGLMDMTGGSGERIALDTDAAKADIASGTLWARMVEYRNANYLMGAGSNSGSDTAKSEGGIVKGHAYAILDVVSVGSDKLVKLRNPWGRSGEWKGDWSDGSSKWTRRMKAKLAFTAADDGIFWMAFEDFVTEFRNLYVCRVFPDSWHAVGGISQWHGESAGGSTNNETCKNNPMFELKVSAPTQAFITLSRDRFATGVDHISLAVYKSPGAGKRVDPRFVRGGDRIASAPYSNLRTVSLEVGLQPGRYVLVGSTFKSGQECGFSVVVHAEVGVVLVEV